MRGLITILLIIFYVKSFSQNLPQTPGTQQRATAIAFPEDYNLSVRSSLLIPRFSDTTSANANTKLDTSGRIIYTYNSNTLWVRKNSPKRWELVGGSVYSASNGLALTGNNFELGGNLNKNTYVNSNGFLFGITGLPIGDTASYYLTVNSLGQFIAKEKGQDSVALSEAITNTPTASGIDSLSLTNEINPWPTYSFYGRLAGLLGTQNLNVQNVYDGGTILNKSNRLIVPGGETQYWDSTGIRINQRLGGNDTLFTLSIGSLAPMFQVTRSEGIRARTNIIVGTASNIALLQGVGLTLNDRIIQLSGTTSAIIGNQATIDIKRSYPGVGVGSVGIGMRLSVDTLKGLYPAQDSVTYKFITALWNNQSNNIQTEKWYVTGRGWQWAKSVPFIGSVSGSDTVLLYKNGFYTGALVSSLPSGGGGGGLSGGNIGSAFRLYYPPSQGIKTVFSSYGLAIDSSTSNQINFIVDTTLLATRLNRDKLKDSLVSLIGAKQNTITESDDNLTFSSNILGTNTPFQMLTDGATITFTTSSGINGRVVLGGNRTLSIPLPQNGKIYAVKVFQDGTGGRTLSLPGGVSAVLRTGINDSTLITGQYDGTNGSWMWYSDYSVTDLTPSVASVTSNTTITEPSDHREKTYVANTTSGTIAFSAAVSPTNGQIITIFKSDASANAVTITTIEGFQSISTQNSGLRIQYISSLSGYKTIGVF